ncbi:MAG: ferritin-like domain-containing protein [Pseudomonadota bacterium]
MTATESTQEGLDRISSHRQLAAEVLRSPNAITKANAAVSTYKNLRSGGVVLDRDIAFAPEMRPARPDKPILVRPKNVPRRRLSSVQGRAALLHAIAHIELNAIDLAYDLASRFAGAIDDLKLDAGAFIDDWFSVGADEGRHFLMLVERLYDLGVEYGDLPAHDGLWQAAEATCHDVAARLALGPVTLEARGLDVTPGMIAKLRSVGDHTSADVLNIIYTEEIDHVAKGTKWFELVCSALGLEPEAAYKQFVKEFLSGGLKPPFNKQARDKAGIPLDYYAWAEQFQ